MKKLFVAVCALAIVASAAGVSFAKDGLSASFGLGYVNNVNDEQKDFFKEEAKAAANKKSGTITSYDYGYAMVGLDIALGVRFDLMNALFVRTGFNYTMDIMGGDSSTTKAGVKSTESQDFAAWAIPLTFGINVPVLDGKMNIYGGLGLSYSSATYSLEIKEGADKYSAEWKNADWGYNWVLGGDAEVMDSMNVFMEMETTTIRGGVTAKVTGMNSYMGHKVYNGNTVYRMGIRYMIPM